MKPKEDAMGKEVPADIILRRRGSHYRAAPPVYRAHPPTSGSVRIRNITGSPVKVWSPQDALLETPREIADRDEYSFPINPRTDTGSYAYTAYVVDADDFVEGNSPPVIIIDR